MITITYVSNKGTYKLAQIKFDTLEQVKKYTSRWFPTEEVVLVQVYEEEKGENTDA